MSVIIRLQNLAWSANAADIREFFKGLSVPEGGVHIVGGEMGDAFIAFSTDEDARLGMMKTGEILKGVQVTLSLSSRTQMQKVIEAARQLVMPPAYAPVVQPLPTPAPQPLPVPPQQQLPFSQPSPLPTPAPMVQMMPQHQSIVQPEIQKPAPSMYRTDSLPVQSYPQTQFPGQPQYTAMFPGATAIKPVGINDNFPVRPAGPTSASNQMPGQYYTAPTAHPADSPHTTGVQEEKTQPADSPHITTIQDKEKTPSVDKPIYDNDKRDRRSDYNRDRKDRDLTRDDRRRRSKSRSRSRDRRRRHRSRSRDRGSRYRRSRSRDRDRGKDRRDKDKRPSRDYIERISQESADSKSSQVGKDGIPGLGDIPAEIAKDKINIVPEPQNEPVTRTPQTRWGAEGASKTGDRDSRQPVDMEIEQIDMEIESDSKDASPMLQQTSFTRQQPAAVRQVPGPDRQPSGERQSSPAQYVPQVSQNGQPHTLEPPTMITDGKMEGPKFLRNQPDAAFSNGNPNERKYQSEKRYDGSFDEMSNRNGSRLDEQNRGRGIASQDGFHSMRPQRPDNSWNDMDGPPGPGPDNFRGPPNNKSGPNEFWNSRGPNDDYQRQSRWSERPEQGRFADPDFYRGPNDRNSYDRGRRGRGMDQRRGGGEFYDQRHNDYQEEGGNFRGRGNYRSPGYMGNFGHDGMRERKPRTTSIEITNVPFNASYKAIRDLFYGIPIPTAAIKILPDKDGKRSSIALMRFNVPGDASEAFKRSPYYIGDSQIGINFCDENRYDNSVDMSQSGNRDRRTYVNDGPIAGNCLKINGLPEACTENDIGQIFSEFRIKMVVIERNPANGELTGTSFVSFGSMQDTEGALQKLQGVTLDGNYLRGETCGEALMFKSLDAQRHLAPSKKKSPADIPTKETQGESAQPVTSPAKQTESTGGTRQGADLLTDSVVIKKVPCDLGKSVVSAFFSSSGIIPEDIFFGKPNHDKKCEVYVVFSHVDSAPKAVLRSGQMMGSIKADIELISKPTVMRVLGLPFDPLALFKKSNKKDIVEISREPRSRDDNRQPARHPDRSQMEERHMSQEMNPPRMRDREPMDEPPRDRPFYPNRPNHQPEPAGRPVPNSVAPDRFGRPGCVVALGNVPYTASTEDILHFFRGFTNVSPDCVIRRYDEFNRPTADARVAMINNDEAMRAINNLNRQYIMNRPIFITLVN